MDDIQARREARRRKILENSDSRLRKITGVEGKPENVHVDADTWCRNSSVDSTESNYSNSTHLFNEGGSSHLETVDEPILQPNSTEFLQNNETSSNQLPSNVRSYKLAILVFVAFMLSFILVTLRRYFHIIGIEAETFHLNKIFIPFLLYESVNIILNPELVNSNIVNSMLLITNTSNNIIISTTLKYSQLSIKILQDLMIYFFAFICCDYVLKTVLL